MQKNSLTSLLLKCVYNAFEADNQIGGNDALTAFIAYRDYFAAKIDGQGELTSATLSPAADRLLNRLETALNEREKLELDQVVIGSEFPTLDHFYHDAFSEVLKGFESSPEDGDDFFATLGEEAGEFIGTYDRKWLRETHGLRITPNYVREIPSGIYDTLDYPESYEDDFDRTLLAAAKAFPDDPCVAAQLILHAEVEDVIQRAKKHLRPIQDFPTGKLGFYHDRELTDNWLAHCRVLLQDEKDEEALPYVENLLRLGYDGPLIGNIAVGLRAGGLRFTTAQIAAYPLLHERMQNSHSPIGFPDMGPLQDLFGDEAGPLDADDFFSKLGQLMGVTAPGQSVAKVRQLRPQILAGDILRIKITLRGSKPPIWRRLELRADTPLGELHDLIQTIFEWHNSHLHAFQNSRRDSFVSPNDPYSLEWSDSYEGMTVADMFSYSGKKFTYHYDFGDSWYHEVALEKQLPPDAKVKYPRCVAGRRAAPFDDMGGIWGFYDYLEALTDPALEYHEDALDYLGEGFDPAAFDVEEIDRRLEGFRIF